MRRHDYFVSNTISPYSEFKDDLNYDPPQHLKNLYYEYKKTFKDFFSTHSNHVTNTIRISFYQGSSTLDENKYSGNNGRLLRKAAKINSKLHKREIQRTNDQLNLFEEINLIQFVEIAKRIDCGVDMSKKLRKLDETHQELQALVRYNQQKLNELREQEIYELIRASEVIKRNLQEIHTLKKCSQLPPCNLRTTDFPLFSRFPSIVSEKMIDIVYESRNNICVSTQYEDNPSGVVIYSRHNFFPGVESSEDQMTIPDNKQNEVEDKKEVKNDVNPDRPTLSKLARHLTISIDQNCYTDKPIFDE